MRTFACCGLWALFCAFASTAPAQEQTPLNFQTSWVGNSFAAVKNMKFIQMDAKDLCVRKSDGLVAAITWWDEAGKEVGLYDPRDGHPTANLKGLHGQGCLAGVMTENLLFVGVKTGKKENTKGCIRRFSLTNYAPTKHKWNTSDIVVSDKGLVQGLTIHGGKIYAAVGKADRIYAYHLDDATPAGDFEASNPSKIVADITGRLWVIEKSSDAYAAKGGRVVCYNTTGQVEATIADVKDPTALAVDPSGQLLVADSDPSRNHIRFYDIVGKPNLSRTFGESISSGKPGQVAPTKFDYITGLDVDAHGNLYVAFNGGGNTHPAWSDGQGLTLRKFSPDGRMCWERHGHQFVDCADVTPDSEEDLYTATEHYRMDYSKPAGKEATWVGYTLNREKYPDDPRMMLHHLYVLCVQKIAGVRCMFITNMYGDYLWGYRLEGETAIPFLAVQRSNNPNYPPNHPEKPGWLWVDSDGQGDFDAEEYQTERGFHWGKTQGFFVDSKGDIWQTREGPNGIARYRNQGVNDKGVPIYNFANVDFYWLDKHLGDNPFTELKRAEYDPHTDRMVLTGFTKKYKGQDPKSPGRFATAYEGWSKQPRQLSAMVLPQGKPVLGNKTPAGAASACLEDRYLFSVAGDATVTVFDILTGTTIGTLQPGKEVDGESGVIDVGHGIRAHRRTNGEYLIFVEEDAFAKVLMYRWTPAK